MEIINYEEKEIVSLTDKEIESNEKKRVCHNATKSVVLMELLMIFSILVTKYQKKFL